MSDAGHNRHAPQMRLLVNGSARVATSGATVAGLLETMGDTRQGVAVAVNDAIVLRSAWTSTELTDGDRVEVLAPTRGG